MANSRDSGEFYEFITVDTAPDSTDIGFWSNKVSIKQIRNLKKITGIYFSIREFEADDSEASDASDITVKLQYMCAGDEGWTDYVSLDGSTLAIGNRLFIEDISSQTVWRCGVVADDFQSGQIRAGFDW
jgi:hypothetical protein